MEGELDEPLIVGQVYRGKNVLAEPQSLQLDVMTQINGFPALTGKPIGVFLQKELSIYNGEEKAKMNLVGSFEADTQLTASEILDKSVTPKNYSSKLAWLEKKPVKDSRGKGGNVSPPQQSQHTAPESFEDDIPW